MEPDMREIDPRDLSGGWADTEQDVKDGLYEPAFRPMRDRGRETSSALVAVRTVLSRAETALCDLERGEIRDANGDILYDSDREWLEYQDEDYDEMRAALEHVVEALEWWRRTGRPRKAKP